MYSDTKPLLKNETEWKRSDKLRLLFIQRILSGLGIFFTIVFCTNLYLIYSREAIPFLYELGIAAIIMAILNGLAFFWTIWVQGKIKEEDQNEQDTSDNQFTRFILFFSLASFIFFGSLILINSSIPNLLTNQLAKDDKSIAAYSEYVDPKLKWNTFLAVCILIIALFTSFCSFAISGGSSITCRLMIYIFGLLTLITSYYIILGKKSIEKFFAGLSEVSLVPWALYIPYIIAIFSVIFLIFLFLANMKKLRIAYLILGTFFLVSCCLTIPAAGQLFRNQYEINKSLSGDSCYSFLGQIHVNYLEQNGCPAKYIYDSKRTKCPSTRPYECFKGFNTCDKNQVQLAWETELVNNPDQNTVLACINPSCCGIGVNIISSYLISHLSWVFAYICLSFILACFCYQMSASIKEDKQMNRNLQAILVLAFLLVLVVGFFIVIFSSQSTLPRKPIVTASQIKIIENKDLLHYPNKNKCLPFPKTMALRYTSAPFKLYDGSQTFTELTDLDKFLGDPNQPAGIYAQNNQCTDLSKCKNLGYIVAIASPVKSSSPCFNGIFTYVEQGERDPRKLKVLSSTVVQQLFPNSQPASSQNQNFFGLMGKGDLIKDAITQGLQVCQYEVNNTCFTGSFLIRVLKIDLNLFAARQPGQFTNFLMQKELSHNNKLNNFKFDDDEEVEQTNVKTHDRQRILPPLSDLKIIQFKAVVFDLENDQPIQDASVNIYTLPPNQQYNAKCDESQLSSIYPTTFMSESDGKIQMIVTYNSANTNVYNFVIFASKAGYQKSCRNVQIAENDNKIINYYNKTVFDIGLGKNLGPNQARVILEWDGSKYEGRDIDLFTTFGNNDTVPKFLCQVGKFQSSCGGVNYHGDSSNKKNGKTVEAITFTIFGRYDYLVYINTFLKFVPENAPKNYLTDLKKASATVKYYTEEKDTPEVAIQNPLSDDTSNEAIFNQMYKFDVLQFCIRANPNFNDMKAYKFRFTEFQSLWNNVPKQSNAGVSYETYSRYTGYNMSDLPSTLNKLIPPANQNPPQPDKFICDQTDLDLSYK